MAVPKRKTSKSRRDKRRAKHGIEAPRVNECPLCHQPKRPAPRLPDLRHVPRPRGRAAPHRSPVAPMSPRRRRRDGRRPRARRDRRGRARGGVRRRSADPVRPARARHRRARARRGAADRSRWTRSPPRRCARSRTARSSPPAAPSPRARPTRSSAGNTGAMLAACLLELRRVRGCAGPRSPSCSRASAGPSVLLDAGANAEARPEHLLQFGQMGAIFAEEVLDVERPQVRLLSIGEEPEKGKQLTLEAYELLARERPRLPRQRREPRPAARRRRRRRHRRLHRQRHA